MNNERHPAADPRSQTSSGFIQQTRRHEVGDIGACDHTNTGVIQYTAGKAILCRRDMIQAAEITLPPRRNQTARGQGSCHSPHLPACPYSHHACGHLYLVTV